MESRTGGTEGIPEQTSSLTDLVKRMNGELQSNLSSEGTAGPIIASFRGHQHIRFTINEVLLAIPLSSALEIGRQPRITPLPNLPSWVLGVTNIRGEIISMVDLKIFFGLTTHSGWVRNPRFMVLRGNEMKVGILVDRILGIMAISNGQETGGGLARALYGKEDRERHRWLQYVAHVFSLEETLIHVLDVEKLLGSHAMNAFNR
jgi:chemotaxis signal transduction protein